MRMIDADELIKQMEKDGEHIEDAICKLMHYAFIRDIKSQPTIDPVKHGHWIGISDSEATPRCSNCGRIRFGSSLGYAMKFVPFCEKCGAKMDEKPCDDCQEFDCY